MKTTRFAIHACIRYNLAKKTALLIEIRRRSDFVNDVQNFEIVQQNVSYMFCDVQLSEKDWNFVFAT